MPVSRSVTSPQSGLPGLISGVVAAKADMDAKAAAEALQKKQLELQYLEKGIEDDPITGKPRFKDTVLKKREDEAKAAEQDVKNKKIAHEKGLIDLDAARFSQTPQGKMLEKGRPGQKENFGAFATGLEGVNKYQELYKKGERESLPLHKIPVIGKQFFSPDAMDVESAKIEAALTAAGVDPDEFKPNRGDSPEIVAQKLAAIKSLIENKNRAYGFGEGQYQQLGYDEKKLGLDQSPEQLEAGLLTKPTVNKVGGGLIQNSLKAAPAQAPQLQPSDYSAAEQWLRQNPNHPDAPGVLEGLKKRGLK